MKDEILTEIEYQIMKLERQVYEKKQIIKQILKDKEVTA